jgi:hypothetical protein
MLPALIVTWIVVSIAAAALLTRLSCARRGAALPAACRQRLEQERVLAVDAEIVVVGRRIDRSGLREVVLDCDGVRKKLSIDELLGAPAHRARRPLRPAQSALGATVTPAPASLT